MSLYRFHKLLRTTCRTTGSLVEKAKGHLAFNAKRAVLIVNRLPYTEFRHRHLIDHCDSPDHISHLSREPVTAFHGDYRNGHTVLLTFLYRVTALDHQVVPRTLEVPDVIRVMDDAHLVSFVVSDRKDVSECTITKLLAPKTKMFYYLFLKAARAFS